MLERIETKDQRRWLTTSELCQYLQSGRNRAVKFSEKCGACKRITSRKNLHDRYLIDKALESM